jgi:hypothetical protein
VPTPATTRAIPGSGRHGPDEAGGLGVGKGGGLAGGPADDEAVAPGGQQVVHEPREAGFAERAAGPHRGHHRDEVGAEFGHGSTLPGAIAMVQRCFFADIA